MKSPTKLATAYILNKQLAVTPTESFALWKRLKKSLAAEAAVARSPGLQHHLVEALRPRSHAAFPACGTPAPLLFSSLIS